MANTIDYVIREEPDTSSPTYEIYQPDPAPAYLVASKYRRNRHQRKNFIDLSDEEEDEQQQQNINIEKCDYCSDNSRQGQEEDEEYHTAMDECNPVTYVVIGRGNSNYDDDDSVIDLDPDDDDDAGDADYRVEQETGTPLTTSGSLKENEPQEVEEEEATETPDKRKMVAKKAAMGRKAKAAKKAAAAAKHREAIKKYHASRKLQ